MFVDASAWTALLLEEPEAESFREKLADAVEVMTSAIANWETVRAVSRQTTGGAEAAAFKLGILQSLAGARVVSIGRPEQIIALQAHTRFGKGAHPAKLNMGDCFAYACARTNGAPLLFKGDDFALTDIEPA